MENPDIHSLLNDTRRQLAEKIEEQLSTVPPELIEAWVKQGYVLHYTQNIENGKLVLSAELKKETENE